MEKFIKEIDYMKHAIGYDRKKVTRSGYFVLWRNYFCCYTIDDTWEELIKLGYAYKEIGDSSIYYHVSEKGIKILENLFEFKYKRCK